MSAAGPSLRIYRSLEEARGAFGPSALTIGNFDGCHLGHRAIFSRVVAAAHRLDAKPSVLTFDPHPVKLLAPERAPALLAPLEERTRWMAEAGIRQVLVLPFTRELSLLSPEAFVGQVLVRVLEARAVLVGSNFRFGHRKAGDTALLAELGRKFDFDVETLDTLSLRGRLVSSSGIRRLLAEGAVARANRHLGRPFSLCGPVVRGHGVGSRQTVPTLNLAPENELLPAVGVYVTRTRDAATGRAWPSVTNVGYRPTFEGRDLSVESFLLADLEEDPPARIEVEFLWRLRGERKFPSPEELRRQILADARRARGYHARLERWVHGKVPAGR